MHQLTRRESQISRLVACGLTRKEIASELRVSWHTVQNILYNVYTKLGCENSTMVTWKVRMALDAERVRSQERDAATEHDVCDSVDAERGASFGL